MQRCLGCMREFGDEYDVCPYCGYIVGTEAASKNHLAPGTVLQDRYILGKALGQGGFGVTYIAWDNKIGRAVAVKEFMPNALASRMTDEKKISCYNEEARRQFDLGLAKTRKEAHALSQFDKLESVVKVHDCIEENGTAYIVMELLRGKTVKEILAQRGRLSFAEMMRIMTPVLGTLDAMHSVGMIHRDVAPDNIFVCNDGKIKLLDFGAARVVGETDEKTLSVMLKAGYAPVEQYSGKTMQGAYTDVYAACATMYKMLTGETPISSLDRIQDSYLISVARYNQEVPKAVDNVLEKGMKVYADERIQTASQLLQMLRKILRAEQEKTFAREHAPEARKSFPHKETDVPFLRRLRSIFLAAFLIDETDEDTDVDVKATEDARRTKERSAVRMPASGTEEPQKQAPVIREPVFQKDPVRQDPNQMRRNTDADRTYADETASAEEAEPKTEESTVQGFVISESFLQEDLDRQLPEWLHAYREDPPDTEANKQPRYITGAVKERKPAVRKTVLQEDFVRALPDWLRAELYDDAEDVPEDTDTGQPADAGRDPEKETKTEIEIEAEEAADAEELPESETEEEEAQGFTMRESFRREPPLRRFLNHLRYMIEFYFLEYSDEDENEYKNEDEYAYDETSGSDSEDTESAKNDDALPF